MSTQPIENRTDIVANSAYAPAQTFAPGARVEIRNEEWMIRRVDPAGQGGLALQVIGGSELVRHKQATFLTRLEKAVRVLHPEETKWVQDLSPQYRQSRLYLESMLRRKTPPYTGEAKLYIGHEAAMNPLPYQLDPAIKALNQPRQRILIADAVGLGKTLECGILLSELIKRGRGQRILVLAIKSLLTQFQKEMWSRFSIPLMRLDSAGIQRIRQEIPTHHNPFDYHDKAIISIDTLKQDSEYRRYIEEAYWDIIVIDEAHNVADRSGSKSFFASSQTLSKRNRLARLLSERSDTLIMLSATPHDGRARSFASLMNMLDPTAIADGEHYEKADIKGLFVRRFKKDILDQVGADFPPRRIVKKTVAATPAEEAAYIALMQLRQAQQHAGRSGRSGQQLFAITLEKALFSSPAACLKTLAKRLNRFSDAVSDTINDTATETQNPEQQALNSLLQRVQAITPEHFSRYQSLLHLIQQDMQWKQKKDDRLVIFTERIETMKWLTQQLATDLQLKPEQMLSLDGSYSDLEQQRVVEAFGNEKEKVRVLVTTDVASEGINLHYLSHRMIHFDIPWSLMTFQQRNGRIDRYGQSQQPEIYYLMTASEHERIRGDQRILEILIEKDEQATQNIGDPSALMGADAESQSLVTAEAMLNEESAEDFGARIDEAQLESFDAFLAQFDDEDNDEDEDDESKGQTPDAPTETTPSLYADMMDYVQAGLNELRQQTGKRHFDYRLDKDGTGLLLPDLPQDLASRFRALPREVRPGDQGLRLTRQRALIQNEIADCRKQESNWPQLHYLWEMHPFVEWLNDRVTVSFGRHEAPVLTLNTLGSKDRYYLFSGLFPNRKGHPLVWEWVLAHYYDNRFQSMVGLEDFLTLSRFDQQSFANAQQPVPTDDLNSQLPEAVQHMRTFMQQQNRHFTQRYQKSLQQHLADLKRLEGKQQQQLVLRFGENPTGSEQQEHDRQARRIHTVFDGYTRWIEDTLTLSDTPYIQVLACFLGEDTPGKGA